MRPMMAINAVILGSCVAITASLTMVLIVFLILGNEHPRLAQEYGSLSISLLIFGVLTAVSAASFYTIAKKLPSRFIAISAMYAGIVATGYYYWP